MTTTKTLNAFKRSERKPPRSWRPSARRAEIQPIWSRTAEWTKCVSFRKTKRAFWANWSLKSKLPLQISTWSATRRPTLGHVPSTMKKQKTFWIKAPTRRKVVKSWTEIILLTSLRICLPRWATSILFSQPMLNSNQPWLLLLKKRRASFKSSSVWRGKSRFLCLSGLRQGQLRRSFRRNRESRCETFQTTGKSGLPRLMTFTSVSKLLLSRTQIWLWERQRACSSSLWVY